MPNVVDALVVLLGLDASGFTKGRKQAESDLAKTREESTKSAKQIEAGAKKGGGELVKLGRQLVALYMTFTASSGVKRFVENMASSNAQLGRVSKTLKTSVEELSLWSSTMRSIGADTDEATESYAKLVAEFEKFKMGTGDAQFAQYLSALKVSPLDSAGNLKGQTQLFLELADALAKLAKTNPAQALEFGRGIGLGDNLTRHLMQGGKAVREYLAEQRKFGVTTEEDTRAAEKLQAALANLRTTWNNLSKDLQTAVSPAIEKVTKQLTRWLAESMPGMQKAWRDISAEVGAFAERHLPTAERALQAVGGAFKSAGEKVGQFIKDHPELVRDVGLLAAALVGLRVAAWGLTAASAALGAAVMTWVAPLLALAAAFKFVRDNWSGIQEFITEFQKAFNKGLDSSGLDPKVLQPFVDAIEGLHKLVAGSWDLGADRWAAWGKLLGGEVATAVGKVAQVINALADAIERLTGPLPDIAAPKLTRKEYDERTAKGVAEFTEPAMKERYLRRREEGWKELEAKGATQPLAPAQGSSERSTPTQSPPIERTRPLSSYPGAAGEDAADTNREIRLQQRRQHNPLRILGSIPGFARGTEATPTDRPFVVGERGPEVMQRTSAYRVMPIVQGDPGGSARAYAKMKALVAALMKDIRESMRDFKLRVGVEPVAGQAPPQPRIVEPDRTAAVAGLERTLDAVAGIGAREPAAQRQLPPVAAEPAARIVERRPLFDRKRAPDRPAAVIPPQADDGASPVAGLARAFREAVTSMGAGLRGLITDREPPTQTVRVDVERGPSIERDHTPPVFIPRVAPARESGAEEARAIVSAALARTFDTVAEVGTKTNTLLVRLRDSVDDLDATIRRNLIAVLRDLTTPLDELAIFFGARKTPEQQDGSGSRGGSGGGTGGSGGGGSDDGPAYKGGGKADPVTGKERLAMIEEDVAAFMKMGWSREQAIGIVANMRAESGSWGKNDFKAVGDGGLAYGVAQWHPDRQARFKKYFGKDIRQSTRDEQLQFIDRELRNEEVAAGNRLKKAKTPEEAAAIVSKFYERPAAVEEAARNRGAMAKMFERSLRPREQRDTMPELPRPAPLPKIPTGAPGSAISNNTSNDNRRTVTQTVNHEVHIGAINTQATDAEGLVKAIPAAAQRLNVTGDFNYGIA